MIEFTQANTRFNVLPQNAEKYRKLVANPPAIKRKIDRNHDATRRDYPAFYAGMTTAEYVNTYAGLNSRLLLKGEGFIFADRVAPVLDPSIPEVIEELDPDYVPPVNSASVRKPSAAKQLAETRAAIHRALCALSLNNPDKAEQILREALA